VTAVCRGCGRHVEVTPRLATRLVWADVDVTEYCHTACLGKSLATPPTVVISPFALAWRQPGDSDVAIGR